MNITGSIKYVSLSGGFWGIEADNGQKYTPVEKLPPQLRQEGLRVKATVLPVASFGIFMWGQDVEIKSISKI
ncbi:MAG: hypothetical protein MRZ79_04390 [Bacteroidia bacterium]|nr:hypothetical protein [Bacteroidia bacterium]